MASKRSTKTSYQIAKYADLLLSDQMADGPDDGLLTTREVAAWFRCSTQHLEGLRMNNGGPKFVNLGPRMLRYTRGACKRYLNSLLFASTADYPRKTKTGARRRS